MTANTVSSNLEPRNSVQSRNQALHKSLDGSNKPRLLDQVRNAIRTKHYSYSTEKTYIDWIKRYIFFHNKQHPKEMGEREISNFLTYPAVKYKFIFGRTLTGYEGFGYVQVTPQ